MVCLVLRFLAFACICLLQLNLAQFSFLHLPFSMLVWSMTAYLVALDAAWDALPGVHLP